MFQATTNLWHWLHVQEVMGDAYELLLFFQTCDLSIFEGTVQDSIAKSNVPDCEKNDKNILPFLLTIKII